VLICGVRDSLICVYDDIVTIHTWERDEVFSYVEFVKESQTQRRAHWPCVLYFMSGRIPFRYILRQMYDIRVCDTGMTYTEKGAVILCFELHIWAHPFYIHIETNI